MKCKGSNEDTAALAGLLALRRSSARGAVGDEEQAAADLREWRQKGIQAVGIADPRYPGGLREIHDPPPVIFYRGTLSEMPLTGRCLAVVGSRKANLQSCEFAASVSCWLATRGVVIVSGLALGVDGAAHSGALKSHRNFATIAVLGNGLESIYPSSHRTLARRIVDNGGLLISQFEPDTRPYPSNFLNRNRIIAGLSAGTLVVEAGERSGSLVTARYALEQGREVLVVPGSIHAGSFSGSNNLIRQGAALVRSAEDVIEELPQLDLQEQEIEIAPSGMQLSELQQQIVEQLAQDGEMRYEVLEERLTSTSFAESILELELEGLVARVPGNNLVFLGNR